MANSPDFLVLSSPRISATTFAAVLRAAGSPAAAEAASEYRAFVDAGVDPAVGLAIFRKESTYGRFGRAAHNRSWGNIRGAGPYPLDSGRFRIYPSWTAGAADAARLLAIYGRNAIKPGTNTSTVQALPYVWAPSSDGNAPDAYGDRLAEWIADWIRGAGGIVNADPASSPGGSDALSTWQGHLASVGIPNDPDHVFTHDEAVKIVDVLYPTVLHYNHVPDRDNAIKYFEGKTVRATVTGGSTSPFPDLPNPLDGLAAVADAIGGIPGALGDALIHLAVLVAILGLLAMGVWLVATSED